MSKEPWTWSREDLVTLIGQPESLQLDFKVSRLFDSDQGKIADNLSKEVSAFANTVGGVIVIGISESKEGKLKVAENIDNGIDTRIWNPERVQQLIVSNLNPFLPGVRVHPIYLSEEKIFCAYVIFIPEGTTAYQSSDKRYYGRVEFESRPLPDHEIRLRMFKGKFATGAIQVDQLSIIQVSKPMKSLYSELNKESLERDENALFWMNRYICRVILLNAGEIDITGFGLTVTLKPEVIMKPESKYSWRYFDGMVPEYNSYYYDKTSSENHLKINIYPQDIFVIGKVYFDIPSSVSLERIGAKLDWKLFLSNRTPVQGQIDLSAEFKGINVVMTDKPDYSES